MQIKPLLDQAKAKLANAKIAEIDAELLLAHELGLTRMGLHNPIELENSLSTIDYEIMSANFAKNIERRISSEPIQYITGVAYFRNLELEVGSGVLIPRPETEGLVSYVLEAVKEKHGEISAVDLGSGSGAIAISLALENPNIRVIAVEKSSDAVAWLKRNVAKYVPDLRVIEGDVSTALAGIKCDVVVANPPYVSIDIELPADVKNHEPKVALFGGQTGLEIPQIFISAAARLLKSNGLFVMEHSEDQAMSVREILEKDFNSIELHYDLNQRPRWTSARRN